jgi:hypothetical protein
MEETAMSKCMSAPLYAHITEIVIDEKISPAFCKDATCASFGDAGQYEQLDGRYEGFPWPAPGRTSS